MHIWYTLFKAFTEQILERSFWRSVWRMTIWDNFEWDVATGSVLKKCVLKNFIIFTGNTRVGVFFRCFIKRDSNTCFPVNIAKFLRTPILKNYWERLLLFKYNYREKWAQISAICREIKSINFSWIRVNLRSFLSFSKYHVVLKFGLKMISNFLEFSSEETMVLNVLHNFNNYCYVALSI